MPFEHSLNANDSFSPPKGGLSPNPPCRGSPAEYNDRVTQPTRVQAFWVLSLLVLLVSYGTRLGYGQLDPEKRRLVQLGYNQHLEGRGPIAGYGFFYYNEPEFFKTNLAFRIAVAPIYVDAELGFKNLITQNTDFGIGIAGGGFADSFSEVDNGVYRRDESFTGHGGEVSLNLYHLFNPNDRVPLWAIARTVLHHSVYSTDKETSDLFRVPDDRDEFHFRAGLRYGGMAPTMTAPLAMELSAFYETQVRTDSGYYGFSGDRYVEPVSHQFWGRALLKYTFVPSQQTVQASLSSGIVAKPDRFSAFRLGGMLPYTSEFPLNLPGYYFQELSARDFVLLNAQYSVPIDPGKQWEFTVFGATAAVEYIQGLEQPGHWHSGLGSGISWTSPSAAWFISLLYGHGFDAIRSGGRGADSVALILQYDFGAKGRSKFERFLPSLNPYKSRAGERLFHR